MESKPRVFLLDANALLHRAWHALPPLTRPDGKVVNAVYGVLMTVMKLLKDERPAAFIACWDTEVPTFRHEAYKEYKGHREEQPDELYDQIPWIQEGLAKLQVPSLFLDGYEADDVLGTLATRAKKAGWEAVIVTSDRDAFQLIQDDISIMVFKKGVTDTVMFDEAMLKAEFGLTPQQFLQYKVMRGDPSDNIPGIRGIGEKGATELLQQYGSLERIVAAAHDQDSSIKAGVREKILAAEKDIPDITKLVTIVTNVPVKWTPAVCDFEQIDQEAMRRFLIEFGFKSLLSRIPGAVAVVAKKKKSDGRDISTQQSSDVVPATSAAMQTIPVQTLDQVKETKAVLKRLAKLPEIVVCVSRGSADSLFSSMVDGLVLGSAESITVIPKSLLEKAEIRADLETLFANPSVTKIGHDVKMEGRYLETLGLTIEAWGFDTLLAGYLLDAGERNYDLSSLAMRYLQRAVDISAPPSQCAEVIILLLPVMRQALQKDGLQSVLHRFEMPLIPVLHAMEKQGIMIDKPYLLTLAKEMTKEKIALEKKMKETVGREFNPASPSQLADVLFQDLKLPTKGIKRGKTGYSTAASELEKLRGQHALIEMIEDYRELSKLLSTYVEVLPTLADGNGRVHTTYNQAIAATGRLSSTDPNLQNIPVRTEAGRKIRRAFVAEEGYVLLSCDYSQIELRLMASLAKDARMLEAFERGEDIHATTASHIWKIPLDQVTRDQRRIAKAINFGLIFGQGAHGLSAVAGISAADAKTFIAAYFDAYQGIKNYMTETRALAHQLGYVETLFGRRRYMHDIQSKLPQLRAQAERMAINMPVQGTDADLMKLAMIKLHHELPTVSPKTRMLLQVHDELVFEVPLSEVKRVASYVKEVMEHVEKVGVPIVVETKMGTNWEEMNKII